MLGFILSVINWLVSILRIVKKRGPSGVPLVGGILMIVGVLIMPDKPLLKCIWVVPIVDFSWLPLFVYGVLSGKFK